MTLSKKSKKKSKPIVSLGSIVGKEFTLGLGKMIVTGYGISSEGSHIDLRWVFRSNKRGKM